MTDEKDMTSIFVNIPEELKRKSKGTAAFAGVSFQDFVALALNYYIIHIEENQKKSKNKNIEL